MNSGDIFQSPSEQPRGDTERCDLLLTATEDAKNPSKLENVGLLAAYAADETYEALQKGPSRDAGGDGGNVNALWLADDADEDAGDFFSGQLDPDKFK